MARGNIRNFGDKKAPPFVKGNKGGKPPVPQTKAVRKGGHRGR